MTGQDSSECWTGNFCRHAGIGFGKIDPIVREAPIRVAIAPDQSDLQLLTEGTMRTWMCLICGWIYDESAGLPEEGIAPGTRWEDVPPNWVCPECGARKEDFEMMEV